MITRLISLLPLLALVSCAIYRPPALPANETSEISPPQAQPGDFLFIDAVDGLPTKYFFNPVGYMGSVTVAPGKHVLRVRVRTGLSEGSELIWLVAKQGASYRLRKEVVGYKFHVWFEDAQSGAVVGGIVGSNDEPR